MNLKWTFWCFCLFTEELRKLSWSGIPRQVRPITWKLLSVSFTHSIHTHTHAVHSIYCTLKHQQTYWNTNLCKTQKHLHANTLKDKNLCNLMHKPAHENTDSPNAHTHTCTHTNKLQITGITEDLRHTRTQTHKKLLSCSLSQPPPFFDLWRLVTALLFFPQTSIGKMNCEAQIIYSWDARCVYSLSHCCGVQLLVCREKTGFLNGVTLPLITAQ